jgi:formate dehydrogenase iron-sulfur subunit
VSKAVLVDLTKCIGCKSCQTSCKQWNDLPAIKPQFDNTLSYPAETDGYTYTTVLHRTTEKNGQETLRFAKRQCLHCLEPACASACFAKAIQKTPEGPVVYNPDLCVGCRYCMLACPFSIPKYDWESVFPQIVKCQFCFDREGTHDRIGHGMEPACVNACPTGCLKFGERDELLKEAWKRINKYSKYIKHVYGEKEAGGTSWLYIADVPFETFDFRTNVPNIPLSTYSHDYLKWSPAVFIGGGALLSALHFYTKRRNEIAKEKDKNHDINA